MFHFDPWKNFLTIKELLKIMTLIKLTPLSSSFPFKCFTMSPKNLLSQIPFLRSPVCLKIFIWLLLHFVQRPTPPVPAATLEYLYAPAAGTTFLYGFWRAEDQVVVVDALSLKTQTGCRAFCVE